MSDLLSIVNTSPWAAEGSCVGHPGDLWFSEDPAEREEAKDICRGCPVSSECFVSAFENNEHGIWGATTSKSRAKLRRQTAARAS